MNINALRRCPQLRRAYATQPPLPELAKVARTASTPLAVRLRRRKQFGATLEGASDATKDGLTPTEQARYTLLKAQGLLRSQDGKVPTEAEWLEQVNARRSRVRGFRRMDKEGSASATTQVLGRRVYLPNIVMRLVRNHTPPGQPYNPYEATFRIPQSVTKTDVRSLLQAVYGVKTTYIRTDNYISPWYRTAQGFQRRSYKTYKRAVVGLVDPFYYPLRLEDMEPEKRKEREEWLEKNFNIQHARNLRKQELLRMTMGEGKASFKLNTPYATKRSHIIRIVNERRAQRETMISNAVEEIRSLREKGEEVDYEKIKPSIRKGLPPPKKPADTSSSSSV